MGIDIQTLFILYAILNFSTIFIFTFFLFSVKEKGDALILYVVTCFIVAIEWFLASYRNPFDLPYKLVISNGIVFLGIVYSFFCLIIANQKFHFREFIQANVVIVLATFFFALFVKKSESVRISAAAIISGILYFLGALMLLRRFKVSKLQAGVGVLAMLLSLVHFYRFYYALKIDPELTLFKEDPINSITFILFFIENFAVGIIILMIHYEKSKKKIERDNQVLIDANSTRDKILSVIAHDLKNYFNAIIGLSSYFDSVEDKETIGPQRKKINLINGASKSAFLLLSNLLEWANAKRHKIVFHPLQFPIREIIGQVIEVCKPDADIKGLEINIDCNKDIQVCADKNMMRTILRNLLFNAIKYSYRNATIVLQIDQFSDQVKVEVRDNGIGMSQEEVICLLEEENFKSKPGTEKEKGNGLGLQICKEFIRQHKARLNIESQLKQGSRFWFYLPQRCQN